jgi:hypothetical protein
MAKKTDDPRAQVRDSLRARGLRGSTAKTVAAAMVPMRQRAQPPKAVRQIVDDLRAMIGEIEDRSTGGPAKRKAAAKKAALTRSRAAGKRSQAARKAAATRRNAGGQSGAGSTR